MRKVRFFTIVLLLVMGIRGTGLSQGTKEAELFGFAQRLYRDGVYDLAAEQFRQLLRDYPDSDRAGEAQYMVGEALYSAEAYTTAASEFQVFLVRFPYHPRARDAWYRMAQCHAALDDDEKAGLAYVQFQGRFSVDDRSPQALILAAEAFLKVEDLDRAEHTLRHFFSQYPQNERQWKAKLLLARFFERSALVDSAFILLDEVIASQVSDLVPTALFNKGNLLSQTDRYDEAVAVFSRIIQMYPESDIIDRTYFRLGVLHYQQGRFQEAIPPFETIVEKYPASDRYASSQLYLAHALREAGDDTSAIEAYELCLGAEVDSCYQEAQYGLALSLANVGRTYEALEKLDHLERRFPRSTYASQAALKTGDLLLDLRNYEAAVDKYRAYITRHPEVGTSDQLQMTIGEIYEKKMKRYQRAADEYHRVFTDYPQSPLTYDALLAIGRCYEQLGDYTRARSAYEDVVDTDPKSMFAQKAQERIDWIDEFSVGDLEEATAELLSLLERAKVETDEDLTFRIAEINFRQLKDFERTIEILESFLLRYPHASRGAETLFTMARAYDNLYRKGEYGEGESSDVMYLQKAKDAYIRLRDGYPDSQWADDAEMYLIQAEYGSPVPSDSASNRLMIERYQSLIQRYPESDHLDEAYVRIGNIYIDQAQWEGQEAFDAAISQLEYVSLNSEEVAEALLKMGLCYQGKDQCELAVNQFEDVMRNYPDHSVVLDAQLGMAECYIALDEYNKAIETYRTIVYRYPQSQLAREVRVSMGDLFAETGDLLKAQESYERILEQGYDLPPDLHFKIANVLRSLNQLSKAVRHYKAYLRTDPGGEHVPGSYYGLARVQEQRGYLEEAAQEYQRLIEKHPESPLVTEAKGRLALVLFDLGQYEASRSASLDVLTTEIDDSLRIDIEAKIVLASYRLGDLVTAETRAKDFRKDHSQEKDYLALFEFEKGNHYILVKNGQNALLAFEKLIADYPESQYGDDAHYGVGLAYLEAGDYEKAVEAFRTLVQEYPRSDLVPAVYLKLGNIYYLQMIFEDAAFAYRRVIDHEQAGDLVPTAMFNLIRTYEAANRQDQALQAAKDLVRRFPDYEDALRVRIKVGYLNVELGNFDQAVEALEEVLPDVGAEEETEVRYWIGESYYSSGKYDLALLEYLKVAYLSQAGGLWAVTAEFKAGQTYEALSRLDEARRLYRSMIDRYGTDSQWGQAAQERLRDLGG